jgi:16S rRNA (cytosine967-C5)-methyltransferase
MSGTGATVLSQAAHALEAVSARGRSADEALRSAPAAAGNRPAIQAITLGSLRWYWRLNALATVLIGNARMVPAVRALLIIALHQFEYSRNPPEVTVSSAVDAVRLLKQPKAAGMVNALLRRFLRERASLSSRALVDEAAASAHPGWLYAALRQAWPENWQQIIDSNNAHPPFALRVNLSRVDRDTYQRRLRALGMTSHSFAWSPTALVLDQPTGVGALPDFADGAVSIQDAGAQLATTLLAARAGERVLDACAAPGGKTCAILESAGPGVTLTAVDIDAGRMTRVGENLRRLQLKADLVTADLHGDCGWWDGQPFDRILVDAPCSATGVIRRHPDIKLLRRATDMHAFASGQQQILQRCLSMLKPGGRLLYSTCSVLPEENQQVVQATLTASPNARVLEPPEAMTLPPHVRCGALGIQLLPGNAAQTDGFYYACLTVT